jgi:hypothetical protein
MKVPCGPPMPQIQRSCRETHRHSSSSALLDTSEVILSLLLLHRFKLKVIPLILLGIGFGSIRYFLSF